jgi:hypothetical protein
MVSIEQRRYDEFGMIRGITSTQHSILRNALMQQYSVYNQLYNICSKYSGTSIHGI